MQGGKQKTKAQADFWQRLRELGCMVTGLNGEIEIHHVVGSSFKHNKVPIGNWYVIPLHVTMHRTGMCNVTTHKQAFCDYVIKSRAFDATEDMTPIEVQRQVFLAALELYEETYGEDHPVPAEVMDAILDLKTRG